MSERTECLKRITFFIFANIFCFLWKLWARFLSLINFFYTLILDKRNEKLAYHCNLFCAFQYRLERYLNFTTDKKGMFSRKDKPIDPLDMEEW